MIRNDLGSPFIRSRFARRLFVPPAGASASPPGSPWAWYTAIGAAVNNGDAVSTWTDQSGNGRNAVAGTAPIYTTNVHNSLPALRFTGNKYLTYPSFTVDNSVGISAFIVQNTVDDAMLMGRTTAAQPQARRGQSGNHRQSMYDGTNNPVFTALSVAAGTMSLLEYHVLNSVASCYENGVSKGTGGLGNINGLNFNTFGSLNQFANWTAGDIAMVVLYNSQVDSTLRQQVESWINSIWSLW